MPSSLHLARHYVLSPNIGTTFLHFVHFAPLSKMEAGWQGLGRLRLFNGADSADGYWKRCNSQLSRFTTIGVYMAAECE